MKKVLSVIGFVLAGLLTDSASGQIIVQPNNPFQSPLILVENKDVQADLKLSEEQVKKLVELSQTYAEGIKGVGFDLAKRTKLNEAAKKGLAELLQAEQAKRFKQLEFQQRGANVFGDLQLVKDLGITNEQRGAIITVLQGFQPKWIAIIQGAKGNQAEIQKKLADVQRDLLADALTKLTAEQQAKFKERTGTPFAGSIPGLMPIFVDMRPQPTLAWHMNDLAAAQVEARKTGKPIFVTFRCEA
jgi:hypothetical protein